MTSTHGHTHPLDDYLNFENRKAVYEPFISLIEVNKLDGGKALEIGCAAGAFLRYLKQNPSGLEEIIGLDPDITSLSHAKSESIVCGSALDLPFPDASFDYVVMVSVLHHLVGPSFSKCRQNWERTLLEAQRVCRPGGHVMVAEGLAVRTRVFQRMIFSITSVLVLSSNTERYVVCCVYGWNGNGN